MSAHGFHNFQLSFLWRKSKMKFLLATESLTNCEIPSSTSSESLFRLSYRPPVPLKVVPRHTTVITALRCIFTPIFSSGSDFWKITVPVPTIDKLRFRLHTRQWKANLSKFFWGKILPFYKVSYFIRKFVTSSIKFIVKCEWKKCYTKETKHITFISSSDSGTVR